VFSRYNFYLVVGITLRDFNYRLAVLLSSFANMGTKITTQWEFRLSLSFLLSKNNQRFRLAKVKVKIA